MRLKQRTSPSHTFVQMQRVEQFINKKLTDQATSSISQAIMREEIQQTIYPLKDGKAPGPDGYSAGFLKKAWGIVGNDVIEAIVNIFETGKLLREVNSTIVSDS